MNSAILQKYGFGFIKNASGDKLITNTATSFIASYISEINDIDGINNYINDINLTLAGQYDLVRDIGKGVPGFIATLYPEGLYFSGSSGFMLPLEDLKELLLSWKEFLEQN